MSTTTVAASAASIALRTARRIFTSTTVREGAGFQVNRPFPTHLISDQESDPFLLLDELGPKTYKPNEFEGAPMHPHRGFTTFMYLRAGDGRHEDSLGNKGIVRAGEVQIQRTGRGIIHDEGKDHPGGLMHGFQIWLNLPQTLKMSPPAWYHLTEKTFQWKDLTFAGSKGARVKVMVGELPVGDNEGEVSKSSVSDLGVDVLMADVEVAANGEATLLVPPRYDSSFIYFHTGSGLALGGSGGVSDADKQPQKAEKKDFIVFGNDGNAVKVSAGPDGAGFLLLCGKKLKEPIARHGPFVMNTQEEIRQAFADYQSGRLGREKQAGSEL